MNQQFYILKSQEGRGFYLNNLKVIHIMHPIRYALSHLKRSVQGMPIN